MSIDEITAKYNISCEAVLANWIKMYNANRELRDYDPKREVYMAEARRKITIKERKEAVEYCIKHAPIWSNHLKDDLIGMYIHSSMVLKCFREGVSDIDILTICKHQIPQTLRIAIAKDIIEDAIHTWYGKEEIKEYNHEDLLGLKDCLIKEIKSE